MGFNPFAAIVGALVPVKRSSKVLLRQELKKYDVDPYSLSSELFDDIHERAYKVNELLASSRVDLMNRMVDSMEYHAEVIASCVKGVERHPDEQELVFRIKQYL